QRRPGVAPRRRQLVVRVGRVGRRRQRHCRRDGARRVRDLHDSLHDAAQRAGFDRTMTVTRALSVMLAATGLAGLGCGGGPTSPTTPTPPPSTATLTATFDQNPVPFRPAGCSFSTPSGWYAATRVQETAGVAVTVTTLTQKLDGATVGFLAESFNS